MHKNVLDYFFETVKRMPDKVAVVHNSESVTFKDLQMRSMSVACYCLEKHNPDRNVPVAVFLPKSIDVVVSNLASMYLGCIFSNLDVKTPLERINNILMVMKPALIITNSEYVHFFEQSKSDNIAIVNIDECDYSASVSEKCCRKLYNRIDLQIDTDPFCIINTSGSTGTPKGVVLNHRSFFDFLSWATDSFDFDTNTVIGSLSPVVFDIYDFELCLMMFKGATIVQYDAGLAVFPAKLLMELEKHKINFIFWVPTIMVNIANMGLLDTFKLLDLKLIWFAGEVFPTKQFNVWRSHLTQAKFVNLYGPIEITLDCIYFVADEVQDESSPLPIGLPCKNTDILILNENDKKCKSGEIGEICVRGTSLAMGYYNNAEKTAAAFVQNPLNESYPELIYRTGDLAYVDERGLIMFKGRKDSLVKHMGYRIELGEVEHLIVNTLKLVKNCCVAYDYTEKKIVLFYEKFGNVSDIDIRKGLISVVPNYMIPTRYIVMEELPRNTNGKIDRLKLSNSINIKR